jgi:uncharacterized membrane protein
MDDARIATLGRALFAASVALLGAQQLVFVDFVAGPFAPPEWLPARAALAALSGLVLAGAGLALVVPVPRVRAAGGAALAALMLLELLAFHATRPGYVLFDGIGRTRALETLALGAIGWSLASPRGATAARLVFAATLVVFGWQHFRYAPFVAAVVPAWIPGPLAWSYATGVAMIAAGLALAARVAARAAALLTGLMFFLWLVLLHAPRVAVRPDQENEWNSLFVCLAMAGACWLLLPLLDPRPAQPVGGGLPAGQLPARAHDEGSGEGAGPVAAPGHLTR